MKYYQLYPIGTQEIHLRTKVDHQTALALLDQDRRVFLLAGVNLDIAPGDKLATVDLVFIPENGVKIAITPDETGNQSCN